jgi:hypothetical protein
MIFVLLAAPVHAQVIHGHLLDDESDMAVDGAWVLLVDVEGVVVARTISDVDGAFLLRAEEHGWYQLRSQRLGYATTTSARLDLVESDSLKVEFRISVEAIPLAPLTVVGGQRRVEQRDPRLERWDYYERKDLYGVKSGFGQFLEGERLRTTAFSLTDMLRQVPGLYHRSDGGREVTITDRQGQRCELFLDGVYVREGLGQGWVNPSTVAAIEVYAGMVVPARFLTRRPRSCVVAVWTGIRR